MWEPYPKGINPTKSDPSLRGFSLQDPVAEVLGKDIASVIYIHLFRMNIAAVNKQYRMFQFPTTCGVSFKTTTSSLLTWALFNYRPGNIAANSNWPILSFKYTNKGWTTKTKWKSWSIKK